MKNTTTRLQILQTLDGYRTHFMDADLWLPILRQVCREHGIIVLEMHGGTPGTFPTFIVNRSHVVKFFGPLFDGARSCQVELAVNHMIANIPEIPTARLLEAGEIPGSIEPWRFLLFEYLPGQSYHVDFDRISDADKETTARQLGEILHTFHNIPVPDAYYNLFPADPSLHQTKLHNWFLARLTNTHPHTYGMLGLPNKLADQTMDFLTEMQGEVSQTAPLHLIHADMTRDHVLGSFNDDAHWQLNGLIDFGDCRMGDIYDELAALYLDFFDCSKRLLHKFLDGYGWHDLPQGFSRHCLAAALQHQFNVFDGIFERHPELADIDSLDQLSQALWCLD